MTPEQGLTQYKIWFINLTLFLEHPAIVKDSYLKLDIYVLGWKQLFHKILSISNIWTRHTLIHIPLSSYTPELRKTLKRMKNLGRWQTVDVYCMTDYSKLCDGLGRLVTFMRGRRQSTETAAE